MVYCPSTGVSELTHNRSHSMSVQQQRKNGTSSVPAVCGAVVLTRGFGMRSLTLGGRLPGPRLDSAHSCSCNGTTAAHLQLLIILYQEFQ